MVITVLFQSSDEVSITFTCLYKELIMELTTSHISDDYIKSKYNLKTEKLKKGHILEIIKDPCFLNQSLDQLSNTIDNLRKKYPGASFEINNIIENYEEPSVEFFITLSDDETEKETLQRLKTEELKHLKDIYQIYCNAENQLIQALTFSIRNHNEII
jgi:hypothetical protein